MAYPILVTFSTIYGSTQEVAERIAGKLRECGQEVDLQPAKKVRSLEPYSAIVLGAPLYMFHWHKEAIGFLSRHRKALEQKPVAVFALGPLKGEEREFLEARAQIDKELAKFPWFVPVTIQIFGGKLEPAKFRFPHNLIPVMRSMPPSDIRDWEAISAWASNLATQFLPA